MALTQAERWLSLETPLGADTLVATEARGHEGISRLFEFTISAMSTELDIKPEDILGKAVTLSMARPNDQWRRINGIVTSLAGGTVTRSDYRHYELVVVPKLWTLDRGSDYRVFQEKSAVEIIEEILGEGGITFKTKLNGSYDKREYCVQFGETHLEFVHRLMAEEGIFYFFVHETGSHTMVLSDNVQSYETCAQDKVAFRPDLQNASDTIYQLSSSANLTDTKWAFRDYNFETPNTAVAGDAKTALKPAAQQSWEQFRYPGDALASAGLKTRAKAVIDTVDRGFEITRGQSSCPSFTPGHKFELTEHPVEAAENVKYVLSEVSHYAMDDSYFALRGIKPTEETFARYSNSFACIPHDRPARGPLPAQKPVVRGPLTAIVVGPQGEEIHTDKYGRIKVQFHWDRKGKSNETSSCFVRVSQAMAGSGWGMVFTPRIGMEVLVQFIDGDPDRPLVTGAVYNGANMPPWGLPGEMTKSGLLTRSTKSGQATNANELSFEDKKGEEMILFHAEKDFTREVENDDKLTVGNDQTRTIKKNRTSTIEEGNETFTIKQGNRVEKIERGNETLDIDTGNRNVTIAKGNEELKVSTGNRKVTVSTGNDELTVSVGNQTTKASAGKILLEAGQGITLKCGTNTIEVTPQGIKVNGIMVTIEGTAKADVKAPMLTLSGDGMLTAKGGLVKIN
jgi:type VI secretion system secreted protein VgrG